MIEPWEAGAVVESLEWRLDLAWWPEDHGVDSAKHANIIT